MYRKATCARDGCLSTDYEERIAELEATLESFAAVDRARQAENAKLKEAAKAHLASEQDRWAANSESELYKANAKHEKTHDRLAALVEGEQDG